MRRPEQEEAHRGLLEVPSVVERRLRNRLGEMVAAQAVEDAAALAGRRDAAAGAGLHHRFNAVLKRVTGDKACAAMTLAELEAAIGWMERNRLADHLHTLDGDPATPCPPASVESTLPADHASREGGHSVAAEPRPHGSAYDRASGASRHTQRFGRICETLRRTLWSASAASCLWQGSCLDSR